MKYFLILFIIFNPVHADEQWLTEILGGRLEYVTIDRDADENVDLAEEYLNVLESRYLSWGFKKIKVEESWKKIEYRKTVTIAVVDTGIDSTHEFLCDNTLIGYSFKIDNEIKEESRDSHGHGTHVAGIIKSVNPNVKLIPYIYSPGQNSQKESNRALKAAVDNNVDIINYSGGGTLSNDEELEILKEAQRKGILVVVAAGNNKDELNKEKCNYYPACYELDNIIVVGSLTESETIAYKSNFGEVVDIVAPGDSINSSYPNKKSKTMSGTSMATPFVSGVASLIMMKHPEIDSKALKDIILASSYKNPKIMRKVKYGAVLDASKALKYSDEYKSEAGRYVAQWESK